MSKNNSWVVWVAALIAVVALIVAVIAIAKVNMTGQGIFEWFKKQREIKTQVGVGEEQFSGSLKGYEIKYDEEGDVIYELINNKVITGPKYSYRIIDYVGEIISPDGYITGKTLCSCPLDANLIHLGGYCNENCAQTMQSGCTGTCTGDSCTSTSCKVFVYLIASNSDFLNIGPNPVSEQRDSSGQVFARIDSQGKLILKKGYSAVRVSENREEIVDSTGVGTGTYSLCTCEADTNKIAQGMTCSSSCSMSMHTCVGTCTGSACISTKCVKVLIHAQD